MQDFIAADDMELVERLNAGSLFSVYRAKIGPTRTAIVKLPTAGSDATEGLSLLDAEFEISRGLTHPSLGIPSDRANSRHGPMLIYPDEGLTSLDQRPEPRLPIAKLMKVAEQSSAALAALHEAGIVHRDVNPSNLVASADGSTARLIDFGSAATSASLAAARPGAISGRVTVAYTAPEQTGRMNLRVDHRADLYSLGVTLYEFATGIQPFADPDAATVIHRHLTLVPAPPIDLNPNLPPELSTAIQKLIEKNPDDRFQSAGEFLTALESRTARTGLVIPDRLYGRADMVRDLRQSLMQGMRGPARLIRLSGPSGSGKSAVVAQLTRPALEDGAVFIQGKFDQLDRARPYSALLQAFDMYLRRLLAGPAAEIEAVRDQLLAALSPNAQVLLDLMPRFERLLGPQPPVPALGLNEAQIRMSLIFRRFVGALATARAPLILFLDDLQWSDGATLTLIDLLLNDPEIRNLTILTAYRGDEVGPSHPARLLFQTMAARGTLEPEVEVGPLDTQEVANLIGDCLEETPDHAMPLARIIAAKTAGNPFFIRQTLLAMARKGLLFFDPKTARWQWNEDRAMAEGITDNVIDLVAERILALPEDTQEVVRLAACSGNQFETAVLSLTAEIEPSEVAARLEPAIRSDVVLLLRDSADPANPRYRFQHDRVQQAAYGSIATARRSELHARIGTILLEKTSGFNRLIEITDHLIAGFDRLDGGYRLRLRDLALDAAHQAMAANAYDSALLYLDAARRTFAGDPWAENARIALTIDLERASIAYLQNRITDATMMVARLLDRTLDPLDRVRVLELQILIDTSQLNYRKALDTGIAALAEMGETVPKDPSQGRILSDLVRTKMAVGKRHDDELLALPRMTDPRKLAAARILTLLSAPAYFSSPNLLPVIAMKMVRMSVKYGNAPDAAFGYVIYGMLHCVVLGDPVRGLAYAELARRAAVELGAQSIEGRVLIVYAGFVQHWTAPIARTLPVFLEGAEKAISAGDLEYHGYNRYGHASYALMAGLPLPRVTEFLEQHLAAVTASRHEKTRRIITMARASVGRMRGLRDDPFAHAFDDAENFALWTEQRDATSLAYFHKYKMLEALMVGDMAEVLKQARHMRANINGILSMAYQPFYQFYEALALIDLSRSAPNGRRLAMLTRARMLSRRLRRWARFGPENFGYRATFLTAELAAASCKPDLAIRSYDAAIAGARRSGGLHDVGLMQERAALFYRAQGAEDLATNLLHQAIDGYRSWGGTQWAAELVRRNPHLGLHLATETPRNSRSSSLDLADSETLIRAAAAISHSGSLQDMIGEVLQAIVINAGASRGVLLLEAEDELRPMVELRNGESAPTPLADGTDLPDTIINYVRRAGEQVVLDDAYEDQTFRDDPYIQSLRPRSVLCVPLVAKGKVVGIVYLENARVRGAFTTDRCRAVEVLGAQAAVSLENARLLDRLHGALERQIDLTSAHARFVPQTFLELLGRPSISEVRLGDYIRGRASILFSDIRGFTPLLERLDPDDGMRFVNAVLTRMDPAVSANRGFVDSYIGDAVMAVFQQDPTSAIDAAIAMQRSLQGWVPPGMEQAMSRSGVREIRMGIGVATGELTFGTVGSSTRLKCSVIGDTVNLASRLEGLTKAYGLSILINEATFTDLADPGRYDIREIDLVTVAGRSSPVRLYEVFDADPEALRQQKRQTATQISEGNALYREGEIAKALTIYEACRRESPDDPLAPILAARAERDLVGGTSPDWDGIERHQKK